MSFHVPNKFRFRDQRYAGATDDSVGNFGLFFIPFQDARGHDITLKVIASEGGEEVGLSNWEHVSVSLKNRCPSWDEMCFIKTLFWDGADLVLQFHPPSSDYVNRHQYCLHLWRKCGTNDFVEMPPQIMV